MEGMAVPAAKAALVLTLCVLTSNEAIVAVDAAAVLPDQQHDATDLRQLRHHFERSEKVHTSSMNNIMQSMTSYSALELLRRNHNASPELVALAQTAVSHKRLRVASRVAERGAITPPPSYTPVDSAKYMLNRLLEENMQKYDIEILKCRDFYSNQCGLIEGARGTVSASNELGAGCRTHILAAQTQISIQETNIPAAKQELKDHKTRCKNEKQAIHKKMKALIGDIEVMDKILKMSACGTVFIQTAHHVGKHVKLLRCKRKCDATTVVSVDHAPLRSHIDLLKSNVAQQLLQQSFGDLAMKNTTDSLRRSLIPASPCTDPNKGAPTPTDKRMAKCTIAGSASCDSLKERFTLIQAGLKDEEDNLKSDVTELDNTCEKTAETLSSIVAAEEQTLRDYQTKLAEATSCEAEAGEQGRLANIEFGQLTKELHNMRQTCSHNYRSLETELCGLKKIRSELYTKMTGRGGKAFFQDCKLSDWIPGECSHDCGGGTQRMTRTVQSQPQGGAKCLPLSEIRSCNAQPCPVDCKLDAWDGWSRCSAECGGGVQQRLRDVKRQMKHNGNPCGEVSETKACNVQSCDTDCELGDWSKWTTCSKECNGGSRKRVRRETSPASGKGDCASPDSSERLQYKKCNMHSCPTAIKCESKLDLVLVLDGSGSLGTKGWQATKKAAELIIKSLDKNLNRVAVLLYSGPGSWAKVRQCYGNKAVNQEYICKIKWLVHFDTNSISNALIKLKYLTWPKGSTLTSLALMNAANEVSMGRKDARTVVTVITDGRPLSTKRTQRAAREVRRVARLMWVPVTRYAPLRMIRRMASKPWRENVVLANTFDRLQKPDFINHIIADMCPDVKR